MSKRARAAIASQDEACYVSVASWWEMAIKISLDRLKLPPDLDRFLADQMAANGFHPLPLQLPHVARVATLPFHHRDPFDRLLIAQALVEEMSLVSADPVARRYGITRIW